MTKMLQCVVLRAALHHAVHHVSTLLVLQVLDAAVLSTDCYKRLLYGRSSGGVSYTTTAR